MVIKDKMESMEMIKTLKLNELPLQYFENYNKKNVLQFINKYPAKYYAVRIKHQCMSDKHKYNVLKEELFSYCKKLTNFTINISSLCYKENQILCGEIRIYKNMEIEYIISSNPCYSVRNCYNNPSFVGKTDIYDKKIKQINGFDITIDYIFKYNLFNTIVEFSVFDCNVGINNEKVVIYELRTDY